MKIKVKMLHSRCIDQLHEHKCYLLSLMKFQSLKHVFNSEQMSALLLRQHGKHTYVLTTSLCLMACRAATKDCHSCLFRANFWMVPQDWFRAFSSLSTVRRHVSWGLTFLRLPSGVQWRAVLVMSSCSFFRMMCPIHLHRLLMMMVSMHSWLDRVSSCWSEIVL